MDRARIYSGSCMVSNPNDPNNQQRLGKVGIQRVSYGLSLDIEGQLWIELGYIMGHVWI